MNALFHGKEQKKQSFRSSVSLCFSPSDSRSPSRKASKYRMSRLANLDELNDLSDLDNKGSDTSFTVVVRTLQSLSRQLDSIQRHLIKRDAQQKHSKYSMVDKKIIELYLKMKEISLRASRNAVHHPYYEDILYGSYGSNIELDTLEGWPYAQAYAYQLLHNENFNYISRFLYLTILSVIFLAVISSVIKTMPGLVGYTQIWDIIETGTTLLFSIEYVCRLCIVRNKFIYAKNFVNMLDLLAILPWYVEKIVQADFPGSGVFRSLRLARIARIRAFRTPYTEIFGSVLYQCLSVVSAVFIFLTIATLIFGTLMYESEHNMPETTFISIPKAMWWTIVTMTAVGYGDMVPETWIGHFLATITILCGLALTAMILMIIGQYYVDSVEIYKSELRVITKCLQRAKLISHPYDRLDKKTSMSELWNVVQVAGLINIEKRARSSIPEL